MDKWIWNGREFVVWQKGRRINIPNTTYSGMRLSWEQFRKRLYEQGVPKEMQQEMKKLYRKEHLGR